MRKEAGFTLIEFAISSAASMVILAATFTLLNMVFIANASMSEMMNTQQNIRVAMNTIARDVVMAGTGLPDGGIAVPHGTASVALIRPGAGGPLSTPNDVMAILGPGNGAGPAIAGVSTDAISIVAIDQESPTWNVNAINAAGTQLDFTQNVREGPTQLYENDLLVITNANGSVFGCVTGIDTGQSRAFFQDEDAMNINQPGAELGNIASLANVGTSTYPPTIATRVMIITYYVSTANPAHPKLMRSVNAQTPQVAVEDIDNLQFSYDLFDFETSTQTANQATTGSPNQIRSVHISLNGRSPKILKRTGDYYRFGLVSKVNVRNATFRNRYKGA